MTIIKRVGLWAAWFGLATLVVAPVMPGRNGSGAYTIPNTFSAGSPITAAGHNQNFADIAAELTNSVAADGQTSMTGPLKAASGTVSAPSLTFASDTDTGLYRIGANNLGAAVGGAKIVDVASSGVTVTGTVDATAVKIGGGHVWSAGDVKLTFKTTADAGWVMMNDGTIGNGSSGASARANADTEALFAVIFDNLNDTYAPLSDCNAGSNTRAGQGTAAVAFGRNCKIALSKVLGRALAIAGSGSGLTARTLGQTVGAETATIAQSNLPAVNFTGSNTLPIKYTPTAASLTGSATNLVNQLGAGGLTANTESGTITVSSGGSGTALSIVDPASFLNIMIKL